MGTWGPGIYQDDVACDIKEEYLDLLRKGKSSEEATKILIEEWKAAVEDSEDGSVIWFALSSIQWKYGRLLDYVKENALNGIEKDLDRWKESNLYKKREKELIKLKEKLLSTQPSEKKIVIPKPYKIEWKNGDIFAYKLSSLYAEEKGFKDKYIYFIKVDVDSWDNIYEIPKVHFFNIISDKILTLNEIINYEYMPLDISIEDISMIIHYLASIITKSVKGIPNKNLTYLGNYSNFVLIDNEKENVYRLVSILHWKELEKHIIDHYYGAIKTTKYEKKDLNILSITLSLSNSQSIERLEIQDEYNYCYQIISQIMNTTEKDLNMYIKKIDDEKQKRMKNIINKEKNYDDMILYYIIEATYNVFRKYFNEDGTLK